MSQCFFFVTYGGAHVQMVMPVILRLRGLGYKTIVLALTTAQQVLEKSGIPYIGFADLVQPGDEYALEMGKKLADDLPTPPLNAAETFAYLGLSYSDLEDRLGKHEAAALYAQKGRQCFEPITVLKRALQKYAPDMVVVTSSPRAEKAAAIAARELGIPSVCIVDLFGRFTEWAADPAYTDKLLVFSNIARDFFIARGRSEKDIIVTGNPAMDRLSDTKWQSKAQQWKAERGWEYNPIVFWASHAEPAPNESLPADIDRAVLDAVSKHPDWRLIVRFHPSEPVRFTDAGPQVYVSPSSEEVTPLIYACDVCVIINSTVGLEAAIIQKPLVSVDLSVFTPITPFAQMGISIGITSLSDMDACLTEALKRGPYQREGLTAVGDATTTVTNAIVSMLSGGR